MVDHTLAAANIDASDIGVVHVANAFGTLNFGGSTATTVSFVVSGV